MESMEDSGFDSDPKSSNKTDDVQFKNGKAGGSGSTLKSLAGFKRASDLQKKIERQRDATRREIKPTDFQRKSNLVTADRLRVPSKSAYGPLCTSEEEQALVTIMDDTSDDEFDSPMFSQYNSSSEITKQLIKDGYNLDLEPDDEDLDLIPPKPLNHRVPCCPNLSHSCVIQ